MKALTLADLEIWRRLHSILRILFAVLPVSTRRNVPLCYLRLPAHQRSSVDCSQFFLFRFAVLAPKSAARTLSWSPHIVASAVAVAAQCPDRKQGSMRRS